MKFYLTNLALMILAVSAIGCSSESEGGGAGGNSPAPPTGGSGSNGSQISVSSVSISEDGKKLIVTGDGLNKTTRVVVLSSDKSQVLHSLTIASKTDLQLEATPTGSNLVLQDGQVLRVE